MQTKQRTHKVCCKPSPSRPHKKLLIYCLHSVLRSQCHGPMVTTHISTCAAPGRLQYRMQRIDSARLEGECSSTIAHSCFSSENCRAFTTSNTPCLCVKLPSKLLCGALRRLTMASTSSLKHSTRVSSWSALRAMALVQASLADVQRAELLVRIAALPCAAAGFSLKHYAILSPVAQCCAVCVSYY